jgi:hypothetical protein
MTTKSKSTHKGDASNQGAAAGTATDTGAAEWAQQVVEHLVDAQKKWIDLTAQQNALVVKAVEEGLQFYRSAPTPALGDWARQGVEGIVEAQRRWAEIASQQSSQLYGAIKDGMSVTPSDVSRAFSDYASQGLARSGWTSPSSRTRG